MGPEARLPDNARGPNKLILEAREHDVFKRVVPVEERNDFLRDLVLKEDSDVPLARDSGYHILQQRTMGISRRAWAAFLGKQSVTRRISRRSGRT